MTSNALMVWQEIYIGLKKVASKVNLKAIAYYLVRAVNVYTHKVSLKG